MTSLAALSTLDNETTENNTEQISKLFPKCRPRSDINLNPILSALTTALSPISLVVGCEHEHTVVCKAATTTTHKTTTTTTTTTTPHNNAVMNFEINNDRIIEIAGGREIYSQSRIKAARKSRNHVTSNGDNQLLGAVDGNKTSSRNKCFKTSPLRQTTQSNVWELRGKGGGGGGDGAGGVDRGRNEKKVRNSREFTETVFASEVCSVTHQQQQQQQQLQQHLEKQEHQLPQPQQPVLLPPPLVITAAEVTSTLPIQPSLLITDKPVVTMSTAPDGRDVVVFDDIDDRWREEGGGRGGDGKDDDDDDGIDDEDLEEEDAASEDEEDDEDGDEDNDASTDDAHMSISGGDKLTSVYNNGLDLDLSLEPMTSLLSDLSVGTNTRGSTAKVIGNLPIAVYEGSPRRYGGHHSTQSTLSSNPNNRRGTSSSSPHDMTLMTSTNTISTSTSSPHNSNSHHHNHHHHHHQQQHHPPLPSAHSLLSSPSVYMPRPGFPQRVLYTPSGDDETEPPPLMSGGGGGVTALPVTTPTSEINTYNSTNTSSTFDYLYEFSETRKVLEEFFKCPVGGTTSETDGGALTTLGDDDDLDLNLTGSNNLLDNHHTDTSTGMLDHHHFEFHDLAYELRRPGGEYQSVSGVNTNTNNSGSAYVGQRLAKNSRNSEEMNNSEDVNNSAAGGGGVVEEFCLRIESPQHQQQQQRKHNVNNAMNLLLSATAQQQEHQVIGSSMVEHENNFLDLSVGTGSSGDLGETEVGLQVGHSRNFTLSPETTDCDSNCGDLDSEVSLMLMDNELGPASGFLGSSGDLAIPSDSLRLYSSMPVLEDGLSSGHASDTDNNNPTVRLMKRQITEIERELNQTIKSKQHQQQHGQLLTTKQQKENGLSPKKGMLLSPSGTSATSPMQQQHIIVTGDSGINGYNSNVSYELNHSQSESLEKTPPPPPAPAPHRCGNTSANQSQSSHLTTTSTTTVTTINKSLPNTNIPCGSILNTGIIATTPTGSNTGSSTAGQDPNNIAVVEAAIKDIRLTLQRTKTLPLNKTGDELTSDIICVDRDQQQQQQQQVQREGDENTTIPSPVWVPRQRGLSTLTNIAVDADHRKVQSGEEGGDEEEADTDLETDRLLGQQRIDDQGFYDDKDKENKKKGRNKEGFVDSSVLIEGVLFRARYLGSTQLVCEGQPTKTTRMMQAEEAVSRIKAPDGETQPSTEVDLFISTEKIMVLNTDLKEIMMDHALRTISYIADIGDLVVLMARRRFVPHDLEEVSSPPPPPPQPTSSTSLTTPPTSSTTTAASAPVAPAVTAAAAAASSAKINRTPKMICHVFESEEAQFIAQSIGQAFQVAYMEFLKANGIEDHSFVKEMDYQEVLNSQEIFGDELQMFAKKEMQKEVVVPKAKGEILGVVIVESGWGSMLPTVVIANLAPAGAAARCGQLNIGDQIIAINGVSLVGLPLSTCQTYIKNAKNQTVVKLTVVPCAPVVEVKIKRPDTKYQLGFSVQNGVICSLLRGGIAERGGVRVGHRIIEINNQSVVAVPHEKIVNLLATSVGEILMKTMPTSMFRLLTGQENPVYI